MDRLVLPSVWKPLGGQAGSTDTLFYFFLFLSLIVFESIALFLSVTLSPFLKAGSRHFGALSEIRICLSPA